MRSLFALALLSFASLGYAVVGPGVVTGNTAVHDPTMCKDNSGKYFVFCASVWKDPAFEGVSSLINFKLLGRGSRSEPLLIGRHGLSLEEYGPMEHLGQINIHSLPMGMLAEVVITSLTDLKISSAIWAPDCTYINGQFWVGRPRCISGNTSLILAQLYYSASSFGSQNVRSFFSQI